MSDYATLQSDVQSAMGRSDIPTYVYRLANATINNEFRLLEMQVETTLAVTSDSVALPADFMQVVSLTIDHGNYKTAVIPTTEQTQASGYRNQGRPAYFAVHNDELTIEPEPDGDYTLNLRYYARQADFSADADTNAVLTTYPDLYLYASLGHAAIWAKDDQSAATYAMAFKGATDRAAKSDTMRRLGPTMRPRPARSI